MTRTFYTGITPGKGLTGSHLWFMHYDSGTGMTAFSRWGEKKVLTGYVSHKRFSRMLAFL